MLGAVALLGVFGGELWLSFHAGGFFAGATAAAVLVLGLVLVAWTMTAARPFDGLSRALAIAAAALILLAIWALLSQSWSDAAARATIEFDRTLLYALAVLLAGLIATTAARRRALLLSIGGALVVVCACGLATRLLPDVWSVSESVQPGRLSYPVTYWNTLGMMGALGIIAALHVVSDAREHVAIRAIAAASLPMTSATVLLTFSRGALVVLVFGVLLYLVLARPRGAVAALLATVVPTAIAVVVTYRADAVIDAPKSAAAVTEGRSTLFVVVACMVAAVVLLQLARTFLEPRILAMRTPHLGRRGLAIAGAAVLVVVAAGAVAASGKISDQYKSFRDGNIVADTGDSRARLASIGNNGRLEHWRVSLDSFRADPLTGSGAGTYALSWSRDRTSNFDVNDGHSHLLETLGELGLVGAALLVLFLATVLIGGALRVRGPDRALSAALLTIFVIWLLRAQIDWDWEMPALTLPALVCAGALIGGAGARAARAGRDGSAWPGRVPRLLGAIGLLVVLLTPLAILRSQGDLDKAVAAMRADDCNTAIADALSATGAMSSRPEPFQVLALCDARIGRGDLAGDAIAASARRDPNNWRVRYQQAVIQASNGQDPRPELRIARTLNPRSDLLREAQERFDTSDPAQWRERARTAPLPF